MIKIEKNGKTLVVPRTAFKEYYENQGWKESGNSHKKKVDEKKTEEPKVEEPEVEESESDEEDWSEFEDEVEKPLSEMNKNELKEKAISLGIDIPADVTNSQLRELIKSALN